MARFLKQSALVFGLILLAATLAACRTIQGAGQEMKDFGKSIQETFK